MVGTTVPTYIYTWKSIGTIQLKHPLKTGCLEFQVYVYIALYRDMYRYLRQKTEALTQ